MRQFCTFPATVYGVFVVYLSPLFKWKALMTEDKMLPIVMEMWPQQQNREII